MTLLFNALISQRYYGLLLLIAVVWLSINSVQAAPNISCTADMNNGSVNLGTITPDNINSASIEATLSYSCTNNGDTASYASVCLAVNDRTSDSISPRYMIGANNSKLAFNMLLPDGNVWGSRLSGGKEYQSNPILIAEKSSFTANFNVPIRVSLQGGSGNFDALQGLHTDVFDSQDTALTVDDNIELNLANCLKANQGRERFPFTVQANVAAACFISATSDINLGSYSAGTTNITGQHNAINVTCPKDTSYKIGLSPSNNNDSGAGIMKGSAGNPDTVAYQLRSQPGNNGQLWGKTIDANNVGNGVLGVGSGVANSHTVYVTVPNTDVKPDNYSDVVSVTINY